MTRLCLLLLLMGLETLNAQQAPFSPASDGIRHVKSCLNHITALQFGDPVIRVAAGNSDGFQIERDTNTVLIKPVRSNASTDLLVWTANGRYAFELDPPGDVKEMDFTIDSPASKPAVPTVPSSVVSDAADLVITKTLLGSRLIDASQLKETGPVSFKVLHVFRTTEAIYLHYSLQNSGKKPLHLSTITAEQLVRTQRPQVSLMGIEGTQIDDRGLQSLGKYSVQPLSIARSERQADSAEPGGELQGVIVIRTTLPSQVLLRLSATVEDSPSPLKALVAF